MVGGSKTKYVRELEISEKFYNDLVDTLKDKVEYKTVRTTKNLKEKDELDIIDMYMIGSALGM